MLLSRFAIVVLMLAVSALVLPQTVAAQTSDPQALTLAAQAMQAVRGGFYRRTAFKKVLSREMLRP